ncbi:hypothetical protein HPB49_008576 [Dermacentor silvarum]|uniref:Uncharacterized protein n=1 Tax=Dermacentor silvarum TaxID=543639 RepID=A0ACB8DNU2_DERSI|nr:hypothetical protein HPB49_008576 [Dermacentor silvarum]
MDQGGITDARNSVRTTSKTNSGRSASVIGATPNITLPQLWSADAALWFIQAENKFRMSSITSEVRKYELFLKSLPPRAIVEARDILVYCRWAKLRTQLQKVLFAASYRLHIVVFRSF